MRSCLAGQRLSAWRSTISQRKVTMTITSSWDVKKACAKLPLFGLSFGFVDPDGSSRFVARGGSSITMGLSTSPQCWLNTSARFLKRRSRPLPAAIEIDGASDPGRNFRLLISAPPLGDGIVSAQMSALIGVKIGFASAARDGGRCPRWVKSGRDALRFRCPLYPQQRTFSHAIRMSALGQKETPASQQIPPVIRSPRRQWQASRQGLQCRAPSQLSLMTSSNFHRDYREAVFLFSKVQ